MKKLIFLFLCCACFVAQAQPFYIAGDSSNRHSQSLDLLVYDVWASPQLDIDCDDSSDVVLSSTASAQHTWPRLSFSMAQGVEVLNSNIGAVSLFEAGDTLFLDQDIWTPHLDFIWGRGVMGDYGWAQIDSQYIAFRKITAQDTSYIFLLVSSQENQLHIHQIISDCAEGSILSALSVLRPTDFSYTNPIRQQFQLYHIHQSFDAVLSNMQGQQLLHWQNDTAIDMSFLPAGIYCLVLNWENGKRSSVLLSVLQH